MYSFTAFFLCTAFCWKHTSLRKVIYCKVNRRYALIYKLNIFSTSFWRNGNWTFIHLTKFRPTTTSMQILVYQARWSLISPTPIPLVTKGESFYTASKGCRLYMIVNYEKVNTVIAVTCSEMSKMNDMQRANT